MVDFSSEKLLRIPTEAAKALPNRPNASTLWRWYKRGVRGIRLETILIGASRYTSVQALERFIARTTLAADGPIQHFTPKARQRAVAAAERELDLAGIN